MSNGKVRVGVVGCGIGRYHVEAYAADPRAELVALAGLDEARCRALVSEHNIPHRYEDYMDLVARDDIDAVSVAVPNHLHLPVAMAAIERGKHVLVEKPIALNSREGQQMVDAAKAKGVILGIAFNRRARPDMQTLKRFIEEGGLGEIYHAKAFWVRRAGIPGLGTWFTTKAMAGGGPLIDLGVHVIDMALWLMGNPSISTVSASTYAKLGTQGRGNWGTERYAVGASANYEVEDLAVAFLRTVDGASIFVETSWAADISNTDEFGVYLLGTKGGAELHVKDYATSGTLTIFQDIAGVPADSKLRIPEGSDGAGHGAVVKNFLDSIIDGVPMSPSGEEGLERARLIDAIYESGQVGHELSL